MEILNSTNHEDESIELEKAAIKHLEETRKWTSFLSITGFVLICIMFIVFIVMFFVTYNKNHTPMSIMPLLLLMLILIVYAFPIYYLYKFSFISKRALSNLDKSLLTEALSNLKKHYKLIGILFIIILSFYIIMIPFALISRGGIL